MVEYATLFNEYLGIPVYAVYKLTTTQVKNFKTIQRPSSNLRLDTAGSLLSQLAESELGCEYSRFSSLLGPVSRRSRKVFAPGKP